MINNVIYNYILCVCGLYLFLQIKYTYCNTLNYSHNISINFIYCYVLLLLENSRNKNDLSNENVVRLEHENDRLRQKHAENIERLQHHADQIQELQQYIVRLELSNEGLKKDLEIANTRWARLNWHDGKGYIPPLRTSEFLVKGLKAQW